MGRGSRVDGDTGGTWEGVLGLMGRDTEGMYIVCVEGPSEHTVLMDAILYQSQGALNALKLLYIPI